MTERIVRSRAALEQVAQALCELPDQYLPVAIKVRKYRPRRTDEQNRRLQWLCRIHAGYFNAERVRLIEAGTLPKTWPEVDTDAVRHSIFNPMFCGTNSSTKPDKHNMADILTAYEVYLTRDLQIELPPSPENGQDGAADA